MIGFTNIESSSGHVIENASGSALSERAGLQFSGYLKATDDSTNDRSVVSDAPTEIDWEDWLQLTEQEKIGTKWLITNAPGHLDSDQAIFTLKDQELVFTDLVATVSDTRINENTYPLIYWADDSYDAASAAGITSETSTGTITFTATTAPSTTLTCDIVFISNSFMSEGGAGGGHVIQDASGTAVAQEPTMQFADSHVSDDPTNEKTVIENIKSVASADYSSETEDGLYLIPDGEGSVIEPASEDYVEVEADGNKTYAQLLNGLYADADLTKVNVSTTKLKIGSSIFNIFGLSNYECYFSASSLNSQLPATEEIRVSSSSYYNRYRKGQFSDLSSTKPSSGTIITLYYGNDKAVVDLQTTANRCLMADGTTVEQALQNINSKNISNEFTQSCEYFAAFLSGNTVSLEFKCSAGTYTNGQTLITIPTKYKPKALQISPIYDYLTGGVQDASAWAKGTAIKLYYRGTAPTNAFAATITYII